MQFCYRALSCDLQALEHGARAGRSDDGPGTSADAGCGTVGASAAKRTGTATGYDGSFENGGNEPKSGAGAATRVAVRRRPTSCCNRPEPVESLFLFHEDGGEN